MDLVTTEIRDRFLDVLPLNYDDTTLATVQNIDVLWLKGRSMARAFEVEHTTAIYSGLLRMVALLRQQRIPSCLTTLGVAQVVVVDTL